MEQEDFIPPEDCACVRCPEALWAIEWPDNDPVPVYATLRAGKNIRNGGLALSCFCKVRGRNLGGFFLSCGENPSTPAQ